MERYNSEFIELFSYNPSLTSIIECCLEVLALHNIKHYMNIIGVAIM